MAEIRNERDKTLQTAAARTVPVVDPGAVIIPGYTGLVLTRSPDLFVADFAGGFGTGAWPWLIRPMGTSASPSPQGDRMVLTASLRGIPASYADDVVWELGRTEHVLVSGSNPLRSETIFTPTSTTKIILTDTPDPLVKTIECSSYPKAGNHEMTWYSKLPHGDVRVRVEYAGQTFVAYARIAVFTG